jgi:hypothetical protein
LIPNLWQLTDYTVNTVGKKGVEVIWSYQNATRMDKPYIVLDYTNNDIPDHEWYSDVDVEGNRTLASWRKATVDMQFYCGPDSMKVANYVAMMFSTEKILDKEMELNVSVGSRLFFSRMPAMLNNSQYEERAIYQFDFYYTEELEEWVSWIEATEIHGVYTGSLTELTCDELIDSGHITDWDEYTTGWDNGETVWDYKE